MFVLAGVSAALSFPLGVFAAVLEGLQKFSWLHLSQIGVALLPALLIAIALTRGGGLVAIGVITTAMTLVSYLTIMWPAYRAFPLRVKTIAMLRTAEVEYSTSFDPIAKYATALDEIIAPTSIGPVCDKFSSDGVDSKSFRQM
ncbi:MAG: hypothetical protein WCA20_33035 [Candidatus Sulfotelmatobacter sp.]